MGIASPRASGTICHFTMCGGPCTYCARPRPRARTFASLLDHGPFDAGVSATFIGARGTVGIEAWCIIILLPCVFRQKKFVMLLPVLTAPCIALLAGEPYANFVDPYLELVMQKLPNMVAIVALMTIFLGGFPTMILCLTMCQLLIRLHKIDKVRF